MRVHLPSKLFINGTVWQCQIFISDLFMSNRWLARYHHHQCWAQRKPISIQMTGTPCPGKLHRYEGFFIGRFWQPGAWEAICFTCWKTALAAPPLFFLCWPKVSDRGFWNIDQLIFCFLIERIKSRFLPIGLFSSWIATASTIFWSNFEIQWWNYAKQGGGTLTKTFLLVENAHNCNWYHYGGYRKPFYGISPKREMQWKEPKQESTRKMFEGDKEAKGFKLRVHLDQLRLPRHCLCTAWY